MFTELCYVQITQIIITQIIQSLPVRRYCSANTITHFLKKNITQITQIQFFITHKFDVLRHGKLADVLTTGAAATLPTCNYGAQAR